MSVSLARCSYVKRTLSLGLCAVSSRVSQSCRVPVPRMEVSSEVTKSRISQKHRSQTLSDQFDSSPNMIYLMIVRTLIKAERERFSADRDSRICYSRICVLFHFGSPLGDGFLWHSIFV